jgi:hypothetical protein
MVVGPCRTPETVQNRTVPSVYLNCRQFSTEKFTSFFSIHHNLSRIEPHGIIVIHEGFSYLSICLRCRLPGWATQMSRHHFTWGGHSSGVNRQAFQKGTWYSIVSRSEVASSCGFSIPLGPIQPGGVRARCDRKIRLDRCGMDRYAQKRNKIGFSIT